jgi:hypothetical protein
LDLFKTHPFNATYHYNNKKYDIISFKDYSFTELLVVKLLKEKIDGTFMTLGDYNPVMLKHKYGWVTAKNNNYIDFLLINNLFNKYNILINTFAIISINNTFMNKEIHNTLLNNGYVLIFGNIREYNWYINPLYVDMNYIDDIIYKYAFNESNIQNILLQI